MTDWSRGYLTGVGVMLAIAFVMTLTGADDWLKRKGTEHGNAIADLILGKP